MKKLVLYLPWEYAEAVIGYGEMDTKILLHGSCG